MEYLKKQPFASGNRIIVKLLSSAVKSSQYKARINRQISNYIESNRYPIEQNQPNNLK